MKMLLIGLLMLAGSSAMAESHILAVCGWTNSLGGGEKVTIVQSEDGKLSALYEHPEGTLTPTIPYDVANRSGNGLGAALVFAGPKLALKINRDAPIRTEQAYKFTGTISIPGMGVRGQAVACAVGN